jgi:hypothetical protein
MPTIHLPSDDHIARHIKPRLVKKDEVTKNAIGVFPEAFALREGERDLSVNWLEFFPGDETEQLRQVIRHTELKLNARHGFGILQVGQFSNVCAIHGAKVRIIHERTDGNPAHASVHRYPRDNDHLSAVLANMAGRHLVLVGDVP